MEGGFILLLVLAIVGSSANTLLFKVTLNAFSSPTTNYGFFVSQASTFLYTVQAAIMSLVLLWRNPTPVTSSSEVPQRTYIYMGLMDAASATLGAIAGGYCPGELQTILNQMIIPVTLFGSFVFLHTKFKSYQLWGCAAIVVGACVASSDYFLNPSVEEDVVVSSDVSSSGNGMSLSVAIIVYFLSVLPSAFSNIYKENRMQVNNMNEVHTSTLVSFYQLWIGFVFLPLLALPSLGGLSVAEMKSQMSDGFTCFMGTNPNDPNDDCSHSAYILLFYILLNFVYNVLLLVVTKRGSAVLLVVSQALSLPLTNIAFTLKPLMGPDVEPLTILDLIGIALVCIGFLAYSGYGFANNFMVAQGPPGQMTYCHFEDQDQVLVSTKIAYTPEALVYFLIGSHLNASDMNKALPNGNSHNYERIVDSNGLIDMDDDMSPLEASERALAVLESSVSVMKRHIHALKEQEYKDVDALSNGRSTHGYSSKLPAADYQGELDSEFSAENIDVAELLQQRYQSVVFHASPRVSRKDIKHRSQKGVDDSFL